MTTQPNQWLDLIKSGLDANKAAAPSLIGDGFYYATDTQVLWFWNGTAWVVADTLGIGAMTASGLTAGTTHTLVGATKLTALVNEISTCANASDAVALPAAVPGLWVVVINDGAFAAGVWPQAADAIDGGSAGVAGALTNAKRAIYFCYAANQWASVAALKAT